MNARTNTRNYDIFKLIVALILLILLIVLLVRTPVEKTTPVAVGSAAETVATKAPEPTAKPTSAPEPTEDPMAGLPEIPQIGIDLTYNPEDGNLYSPDGKALFALSDLTGAWEPLIPEDLAGSLPEGAKLLQTGDGGWEIVGSDGNPLYSWDLDSFSWQMVSFEEPEIELPPYPQSDLELTYNPEAMTLVTEDGIALFRLDATKLVWEPIVPVDITAQLPEGAQVVMDENGEWLIHDSESNVLYTWDGGLLSWQMASAQTDEMTLPPFPDADVELTYDEASSALITPDGKAVYLLDTEFSAWEPVLPVDIMDALPDGALMALGGDGTWGLFDPGGNLLYTWDPAGLTWVPEEQSVAEPPSQDNCPLALPSRLAVGWGATVTTNLNMRSSPGIADNWI
jgi:hypothetical protein